jgi:membrane dipeptidase
MTPLLLMTAALAQSPTVQVDLHVDTPTQMLDRGLALDSATGLEAGLVQLRQGGTNVVVEVLWPPRGSDHRARAVALMDTVAAQIDGISAVGLAKTPAAARALVAQDKLAIVISMEGAHGLGDDERWRETFLDFYSRGLRLIGLTWSFSNRFAGASGDRGGGLTDEGRELVAMARAHGVVLDVSHASRQTTLAVCKDAPAPVIASHSVAHALTPVARNLTDEEIRCIAATGGVIGLNFHAPFIGPGADISRVADHADHLAKIGGHEVVALGSDYDGFIKKPLGLEHAGKVPALWAELKRRGWTEPQLLGIKGENFMRAWAAAQAAAKQ